MIIHYIYIYTKHVSYVVTNSPPSNKTTRHFRPAFFTSELQDPDGQIQPIWGHLKKKTCSLGTHPVFLMVQSCFFWGDFLLRWHISVIWCSVLESWTSSLPSWFHRLELRGGGRSCGHQQGEQRRSSVLATLGSRFLLRWIGIVSGNYVLRSWLLGIFVFGDVMY